PEPARRRGGCRRGTLRGPHGAARSALARRPDPANAPARRDARRRGRSRPRGRRRPARRARRVARRRRRRCDRRRRPAARERAPARGAGAAARGLADRQRPPLVRPAPARDAARCAPRLRRALGLRSRRPHRARAGEGPVSDRRLEQCAGAARGARPRARRAHRRAADRTPRRGGAPLGSGQPRAVRDDRPSSRSRAPGRADVTARSRTRGNVDRHRLARDDGERGAQRTLSSSARLEHRWCESYSVTATAELTALDSAIDRGTRRLLDLQRPDGIWVGELESNVTMTAQHLFWNHALGLRTPELDRGIANELLARMRDDGTWSIWFEGPADLSTSIEAYVALRMCGVDPGPQALAYIRSEGGIPKARLFTKCFLALLGQWPWQRMVPVPPELVLLPPSAPFSI